MSVSCAIQDRPPALSDTFTNHAVLAAFSMKRTAAALLIAWVCLLPTSCYGQESPSVRPQVVLDPYSSNKVAFGAKTLDRVSANSGFRSVGVQELLQRDPDLGVDLANERLLYACSSLRVRPGSRTAAAAAAAAVQAAAFDAAVADATLGRAAAASSSAADQDSSIFATATSAQSGPTETVVTEAGTAAGGRRRLRHQQHHHHHHERKLLQAAAGFNAELPSLWLPEMADAPIDEAQAFSLHSRPAAVRKIYLDFDGHTTTGADWNMAFSVDAIVTPPFDMDGDPGSWAPSELATILAVWRGVSEDYAPWDVDVTTEQPNANYPVELWARVAIGGSGKDWLGSESGGVAYVNAWGRDTHTLQPAFVFAQDLQNYAKAIWEASSHEVGHQLGLKHDGDSSSAYYQGKNGWAPIMGMGHEQAITQWSKGEYPGANNKEDDIQIISASLPLISDSYGNSLAAATYLGGSMAPDGASAIAKIAGVIRETSDTDVFQFQTNTDGRATIQVLSVPLWPGGPVGRANLYMQVRVMDASGSLLALRVGAGVRPFGVDLPAAGTYYVLMQGVGTGDPASDGFSSYGSLGQYQLFVKYPSTQLSGTPNLPPELPQPPILPPPDGKPKLMSITLDGTKSTTLSRVLCLVTVIVTDAETGAPLTDVYVGGTWSARRRLPGWPHDTAMSTADTQVAVLPALSYVSTTKGHGCVFRLVSVLKAGYALSPNSKMIVNQSW